MDVIIQKRLILYANLMEEAKVRITLIDQIVQGRGDFHDVLKREFCFFQLRLLCELIALSCLVAHGDIESLKAHKIGKAYSADEIMKRLEVLRPTFYPVGVTSETTIHGHVHFTSIEPHPFPKDKLLALYGITHRYVHRGSLKGLLRSDVSLDLKFNAKEIIQWAQRVSDMLSQHLISINEETKMVCQLYNLADNMRVQVAIAETPVGYT